MINKIFNLQFSVHNSSRGFTVLEAIVAIAVLSISVSGAFSAVQQSLSQAVMAKDEVKAFYLAQEAVEIIKNKRDSNQLYWMSTGLGDWLTGITSDATDPCYFGKICRTDAKSFSLVDCSTDSGGVCPVLKQYSTTFLYNYNAVSGTNLATNFKREIQIESISSNEIAVIVRIVWTKGIITREFKIKQHLFNWI